MLVPFDSCKTPKEQQPSFLLGQFQIELRKTFPQSALEVLRVSQELEASHKIIRETHQVRLATALCFEFLFKPQVEREVQVNVTQHRRYWAALPLAVTYYCLPATTTLSACGLLSSRGSIASLALRPACRSCLRLTHVVAFMSPRLDSRWGGSFPFPRREFRPLEASGFS